MSHLTCWYRLIETSPPSHHHKRQLGIYLYYQPNTLKLASVISRLYGLTTAERRASMTWAQRLKRVFDIDIETCNECGGNVRIIASIEDPVIIRIILDHLDTKAIHADLLPQCRAPPVIGFLPGL